MFGHKNVEMHLFYSLSLLIGTFHLDTMTKKNNPAYVFEGVLCSHTVGGLDAINPQIMHNLFLLHQ
jgi:hypothetical protein